MKILIVLIILLTGCNESRNCNGKFKRFSIVDVDGNKAVFYGNRSSGLAMVEIEGFDGRQYINCDEITSKGM